MLIKQTDIIGLSLYSFELIVIIPDGVYGDMVSVHAANVVHLTHHFTIWTALVGGRIEGFSPATRICHPVR